MAVAPVFDFGTGKTPRPYDAKLQAEVDDIVAFWTDEFPRVFGSPYPPFAGKFYAGYPGRTNIPGCGAPTTDYQTQLQGNAFYCSQEDFVTYDDAQLFPAVYDKLGAIALGVIMAHEMGHAAQFRAGVPDTTQTIVLEQQADCYAGAWTAHLAHGENPSLPFGEADVKNALLALMSFKDPIGANPAAPGAHGSGFDRVGAFEDGFTNDAKRCSMYIQNLPPILELPADPGFLQNNGNSPLDDPNHPQLPNANDPNAVAGIYGLLITDLPTFWNVQLQARNVAFSPPKIAGYDISGPFPQCSSKPDFAKAAYVFCPGSNTVGVNRSTGQEFYDRYGDYAVGYLVSDGYSEAVQTVLGSNLTGAKRALLDDCLTGAYTQSRIPNATSNSNGTRVTIQAGDLDEAVQTAVAVGDSTTTDNIAGTAFQKVAAFRSGVLGGLAACTAQMTAG